VVSGIEIFLPLSGMVDSSEEKERLNRELQEARSQIERLERLLSSDFASKAPAQVVEKERQKLQTFKETADKLTSQLTNL